MDFETIQKLYNELHVAERNVRKNNPIIPEIAQRLGIPVPPEHVRARMEQLEDQLAARRRSLYERARKMKIAPLCAHCLCELVFVEIASTMELEGGYDNEPVEYIEREYSRYTHKDGCMGRCAAGETGPYYGEFFYGFIREQDVLDRIRENELREHDFDQEEVDHGDWSDDNDREDYSGREPI